MKGTEAFVKIRPADLARIVLGCPVMGYSVRLASEVDLRT
jgi:hypothetical protein